MSLNEELKKFSQSKLKKTSTTVKTEDGRMYDIDIHNENLGKNYLKNNQPGYVVDDKPDLSIDEILPNLFLCKYR